MMWASKYRDTSIGYGEREGLEGIKGRERISMQEYRYVRLLEQVGKEDLAQAGGKGANLGEMIRAGLPVPGGFVILVEAYHDFVQANGLEKEIEGLLFEARSGNDIREALDTPDSQKTLKEKISWLQEKFSAGQIPPDIEKEVDQVYEYLEEPRIAVRSSATAEDLPGTSFAGQYSTYLNISGKEELYEAIKKCWASLWNERAVSYREKQGMAGLKLGHGVVVQKLLSSEKSGIIFTANPVNGRRDQVSINCSWGLGEAIVGGQVDPDQWIMNKSSGEVVSEQIAVKRFMTVRNDRGVKLVPVEAGRQEEVTLDEKERKELLELAVAAEKYFRFPQDLEWACEGGVFYLVQARPVTALYPMPEPEESNDELRIYLNLLLYRNGFSAPLTPAAVDFFRNGLTRFLLNRRNQRRPAPWIKSPGGRIFVDITEPLRYETVVGRLRSYRIPALMDSEPMTIKVMAHVADRNSEALKENKNPLLGLLWSVVTKIGPGPLKLRIASRPKLFYGKYFPYRSVNKAIAYAYNQLNALKERRKKLKTLDDKLKFVEEESLTPPFKIGYSMIWWMIPPLLTSLERAEKIIGKHSLDTSELEKVKRAVPNSVTTEMGLEMLQIAKRLDQADAKASADHPEIIGFLEKYGHRSSEEIDFGVPRWKEQPGYIVDTIQSYIDQKTYRKGIDKLHRDQEEAERAIEHLTARLEDKGASREARKLQKLLRLFRDTFGYREMPKFIMVQAMNVLREVLAEVGKELAAEGRLKDPGDIFFVGIEDIKAGGDLREKAACNREEYLREMQRTNVPRLITSYGEAVCAVADEGEDGALRGIPASAGIHEGPVKIVMRPEEGRKLRDGDILVTMSTDPSWTPLFLKIGGLIMETGATLAHGPVVAREYNIPAVVGVGNATGTLKDGQIVRLNGEAGTIEVLS